MDDVLFMRGFECFTDALGDVEGLIKRNRPSLDALGERFTFHEFQHEKARAVRFLKIVDGGDIRMIERGEHFRFTLEAGDAVMIAGKFVGQDLDGHFTLQLGIACAINLSHASATKQGQDFYGAELCADGDAQSAISPCLVRASGTLYEREYKINRMQG